MLRAMPGHFEGRMEEASWMDCLWLKTKQKQSKMLKADGRTEVKTEVDRTNLKVQVTPVFTQLLTCNLRRGPTVNTQCLTWTDVGTHKSN